MTNETVEEVIETGNAISISSDQISIHPALAAVLDETVMAELIQYSFTYQVTHCMANTVVFPVIPKKGMKKNRHYYLIGLVPYFCMLERKGHKQFKVAIVDEPSNLDLVIGNTYQMMPLKRGIVANAILAALVEKTNNSPVAIQSGVNFIELENCNRRKKCKDPLETVTGFKMQGLMQTLRKEQLSESAVELLKVLSICLNEGDSEIDGDDD